MSELQITGRVSQHMDEQTGEGKNGTWRRGGVVLHIPGKYPKDVALDVWGDDLDKLPSTGDTITAHIDLQSREYNGKWYTNAKMWKYDTEDPAQGNNDWADDATPLSEPNDDLPSDGVAA